MPELQYLICKIKQQKNLVIIDADNDYFYGLMYPVYFKSDTDTYKDLKLYLNEELNPIILNLK